MKVIVCELCEGQNFAKQDGKFVCQGCGTQYSPEEAKALMREVEGEAPAAAPAAKSGDLEKYLLLARRAKDSNNNADAAKYYSLAEAEDPNSWEAMFYGVYFSAMQTNIAGITSAANLVTNCLPAVIDLIKNHTSEDQQLAVVTEVVERCNTIALMLYSAASNHYNGIGDSIRSNYLTEYRARAVTSAALPSVLGDELDKVFGSNPAFHQQIALAWKQCHHIHESSALAFPSGAPAVLLTKIGRYDKDFIRPHVQQQINSLKVRITKLEETTVAGGCGSVFCIVLGAIFTFLALVSTSVGVEIGMVVMEWLVGLPLLIGGIIAKMPKQKSPDQLAKDQALINNLKQQIAELEASIK